MNDINHEGKSLVVKTSGEMSEKSLKAEGGKNEEKINLFRNIAKLVQALRIGLELSDQESNAFEKARGEKAYVKLDEIDGLLGKIKAESEVNKNNTETLPRWIRIARLNRSLEFDTDGIVKSDVLATNISKGIGYTIQGISLMQYLTFIAEEYLEKADALVAMWGASEQVLVEALRKEFYRDFNETYKELTNKEKGIFDDLVKKEPKSSDTKSDSNDKYNNADFVISGTGTALNFIDRVTKVIPAPEDVEVIKKELYKLFVIKFNQKADKIDIESTGKIRMLQWLLYQECTVNGLPEKKEEGADKSTTSIKLRWLGSRVIKKTELDQGEVIKVENKLVLSDKAQQEESDNSTGLIIAPYKTLLPKDSEKPVYENDIKELDALLKHLNYTDSAGNKLSEKVAKFQEINDIYNDDVSKRGNLDEITINRLMGVCTKKQTLIKPKPFEAQA